MGSGGGGGYWVMAPFGLPFRDSNTPSAAVDDLHSRFINI